jgi:hypothetical protein
MHLSVGEQQLKCTKDEGTRYLMDEERWSLNVSRHIKK